MEIAFNCCKEGSSCGCTKKPRPQRLYYSPITNKYYKLCEKQIKSNKFGFYLGKESQSRWEFWEKFKLSDKTDTEKICKNK